MRILFFFSLVYRAQITGTEGSKPVDANAVVSNISTSVPAKEEVKVAANSKELFTNCNCVRITF